jgi:phage gp29-like protein
MPTFLQRNWNRLRGAASDITSYLKSPADSTRGLIFFGESNLVDPPRPIGQTRGSAPTVPSPGTIVKAQVAERWINQVTRGLTPEAIDDYLTSAISGDTLNQFALFEEMEEKWPELRLALYKHKLKAARRNPRIVPPDHPQNPALAREKADFANHVFAGIRNWHRTAFNLLDAVGKGISAAEIDWEVREMPRKSFAATSVVIAEMPWVNYRHWSYWWDKPELQLFPDLRNRALHFDVPDRKFVVFHHLSKSGHPSRAAMLRPLAWYFLIYLFAMKDWGTLAETFGVDVAHAFCSKDATQEQRNTILMHLSRLAARAGVFDEGTAINLQRAATTSSFPQETIVKYCSEKALECLLGATLATQAGERGARSLGLVQQDETEELVDWTCLLFAGTMTGTALRWLMEFNFAEPGDNPVMELPGANRRDLAALANVLNILVNLGVRIPEAWVHAQFDIPQPTERKETEDTSQETGAIERILTPNHASTNNQTRTDTFGSPLNAKQAQRALDAIRLRAIAEGCDLRAFDELAAPIESLIGRRKSPADALHELKTAADALAPAQLDGIAPQLLILGDLLARDAFDSSFGNMNERRVRARGLQPSNSGDHHD